MGVRTKSLAAATLNSSTPSPIYTVPAGETAIIKSVAFAKLAAGAVSCDLSVLRAGTSRVILRELFPVTSTVSYREFWIVLQPDDVLRGAVDTGTVTLMLSGTELEGVAD